MPPDDASPSEPKRLRLRSTFGDPLSSPPVDSEPSAANGPPSRSPGLKLGLPEKSSRSQTDTQPEPPPAPPPEGPPAHPGPETDAQGNPATCPGDKATPSEAGQRKTSPVYYILLVVALLGSLYVLFKDKWATEPSPGDPPRTLAGSPDAPNLASAPLSSKEVTAPEKNARDLPGAPANLIAALQANPPLYLNEPKGLLLKGIVFPVGSLLTVDPEVRLEAIEESPEGRVAVLSSEGHSIRIPLR